MSHHHGHDSHSHNDISHDLGHVVPFSVYRNVFVALIVLTVVTVAISRVDFGAMNIVIAMLVASVKAMLVAMFFMHLKYEKPLTWMFAFFPIFLLALLIGGVFLDNPLRSDPKVYISGQK
jgi:cytochrome c oxidase subunit 4